jgi:hypothetical protein
MNNEHTPALEHLFLILTLKIDSGQLLFYTR